MSWLNFIVNLCSLGVDVKMRIVRDRYNRRRLVWYSWVINGKMEGLSYLMWHMRIYEEFLGWLEVRSVTERKVFKGNRFRLMFNLRVYNIAVNCFSEFSIYISLWEELQGNWKLRNALWVLMLFETLVTLTTKFTKQTGCIYLNVRFQIAIITFALQALSRWHSSLRVEAWWKWEVRPG